MRWLVTGGCGFVGTNLSLRLLRDGHDVGILDNLSRPGSERNYRWLRDGNCPISFYPADIRDAESTRVAIKRFAPDVVAHLAAQTAVTTSMLNPRDDFATNALGTLNVLEAARTMAEPPAVLFASTNKVYGNLPFGENYYPNGVPESAPVCPETPYGVSKAAGEWYVHDYATSFGLRTIVFRCSCMYGERQFGSEDQGWLAHFAWQAAKQKPVTVFGSGNQVRDILWIDDAVDAFVAAALQADHLAGSIFNLGGGPSNHIRLNNATREISKQAGTPVKKLKGAARPSDQQWYISDIERVSQSLRWHPKVSAFDGIARLVSWVRTEHKRAAGTT